MGDETRETAGPVLPGAPVGSCLGGPQLRAFDILTAWRTEGPDRNEKLSIQSGLRWGLPTGFGGFAATVAGGCNSRTG